MSGRVKVSIIVPAYNSESFIADALESIRSQTYTDYEVLVIDDHSSDGTYEVARKFGESFFGPRFKMLKRPCDHARGPAATRNEGLRHAKGEFIAFLDADDIWLPHHLETGLRYLSQYQDTVGVYFARMQPFGETHLTRTLGGEGEELAPFVITAKLLKYCCVNLPASITRHDLIKEVNGFDERLTNCMDWWLWLRLSKRILFYFNPSVTSQMRIHPASTTRSWLGVNQAVSRVRLWSFARDSGEFSGAELDRLKTSTLDYSTGRIFLYFRGLAVVPLAKVFSSALKDGPSCWHAWLNVLGSSFKMITKRAWRWLLARSGLIPPDNQFL
jgi:glycosyltransferase involved in cell wall biosynthesis